MKQITITRPDDWHVHLRDELILDNVVVDTIKNFSRALIMPNLIPPIINISDVISYKERIINSINKSSYSHVNFKPLMTIYLTDYTKPEDIEVGFKSGIIFGAKLYPFGSTTNSHFGVTDIFGKCSFVLAKMEEIGMPLSIHGEILGENVDIFDREALFIEKIAIPLKTNFPKLKIVLEHITTKDAIEYVLSSEDPIAATVTPQHLMYNRNDIFKKGLNPHLYCLPILKREYHRSALLDVVTSGNYKFFIGTDSAPHDKNKKENKCGCAGCYSAFHAIELYTTIFDRANSIENLEKFMSFNGPDFYGLPYNSSKITLIKTPYEIPEEIYRGVKISPLGAGEIIDWKVL